MENIFQTVNDIQQSPLWGLAWKLLWFSIAIIWVSLILWTLKDARKRIDDGLIVGVAVATSLVFPFIGTLVYTILRPSEYLADAQERELEMAAMDQSLHQARTCPKCEEPVLDGFIICPRCRRELRRLCRSCGQPAELHWKICPYCMHDGGGAAEDYAAVSYTHLRAHETDSYLVCRLLLEKKKKKQT